MPIVGPVIGSSGSPDPPRHGASSPARPLVTGHELRAAIAAGQLRIHAQPKVDLRDGHVAGVEVLVRWQHPVHGLLLPDDFLPLAERSGSMVAIGDWVLDEAIALAERWREVHDGGPLRVWVNLATQQLADEVGLCERVSAAIASGRITARSLGFEVTESSLLEDLPSAVGVLSALRELGIEIALDDFGTGYSSLSYLRRLPVTAVKIDRSFVAGIGGSLADEAIVAAVVDLAHALGLRVVAEGIEEPHQADALIVMGAELAQGFYFGRPQEPALLEPRLGLAWCGAPPPSVPVVDVDRRADALPGSGSPGSRLLLTALDSAHDSIVVTTAGGSPSRSVLDTPIVYVNAAFELETGYRARDVLGRSVRLLFPDGGDDAADIHREDDERRAVTVEWTNRRADGRLFACEVTLSPISDGRGVHTHWLHVRRDLTQRRVAEAARARVERLMEQSTSLVLLAETTGEWIYANAPLRRALGLPTDGPLDGVTNDLVMTPEQRRLAETEVRDAIARSGRWSGETVLRNLRTGELTEVASDVQLVDDPLRPGVLIYASVSREIGEIKALERAEQRRRELSDFAANLATRALDVAQDEVLDDLDHALESFAALLHADLVFLDLIDLDANLLVPLGGWSGGRRETGEFILTPVSLAPLTHWLEHLRSTVVTTWRRSDGATAWTDELDSVFPGAPIGSRIGVPLRVGGELIAVLGLATVDEHEWTVDEVDAVQQIAAAFAGMLARRRAHDALRASEARLAAMLESIGDVLVVLDGAGFVRYVNAQAEDVLGYAPDTMLDRHFLEFVHPDDHEWAVEAFAQTVSGVELLPVVELRVVHADGTISWFDIDTKGGDDPVVGGYMLSLRDVSAQHEIQRSERRRSGFEKVVLDLSRWALDVESEDIVTGLGAHLEALGRALDADSAFAALLEHDRVRNVAGWKREGSPRLSYAFPAGDAAVPAIVARYCTLEPLVVDDIDQHDEAWADEWRSFPVPDRAGLNIPLVSGGRCLGNIGVAMAFTPRHWEPEEVALVQRVSETVAVLLARHRAEASLRTSESRLSALLDGSQDLVVVVDGEGCLRYVNGAVERVLGYDRNALIGCHVATLVHPDDWQLASTRLESLLADHDTPMTTVRLVRADGTVGSWEITGGMMRDPVADGRVLTARDVTDRIAQEVATATRVTYLSYAFELAQSALDLGPREFLGRLGDVCREIAALLRADIVYVDHLDPERQCLANVAAWRAPAVAPCALDGGGVVPFALVPAWVGRMRETEPVVAEDLALETAEWAGEKRRHLSGERSMLAVGMTAAGELFGVLGVSMADVPRAWTEDEIAFLRIAAETIAHVLERARLDDALRSSETRFRLLSETAADVVVLVDAVGIIRYVSPSSVHLTGWTPEQLVGRSAIEIMHPEHRDELMDRILHVGGVPSFTAETRLLRADGSSVWVASSTSVGYDHDGRPVEFRASLRDITDRKRLEWQLEQQALHDPLTGLANRALLRTSLSEAAARARDDQLAVLLLDLDGFKEVNDSFGHAVGDEVLQVIASRLVDLTRSTDTVARTGGDEFVLLCPGIDEAGALAVAERIVRVAAMPVLAGETTVRLGASVGVAHGARDRADPDRLLLEADRAMYGAKRAGRGCVRLASRALSGS